MYLECFLSWIPGVREALHVGDQWALEGGCYRKGNSLSGIWLQALQQQRAQLAVLLLWKSWWYGCDTWALCASFLVCSDLHTQGCAWNVFCLIFWTATGLGSLFFSLFSPRSSLSEACFDVFYDPISLGAYDGTDLWLQKLVRPLCSFCHSPWLQGWKCSTWDKMGMQKSRGSRHRWENSTIKVVTVCLGKVSIWFNHGFF